MSQLPHEFEETQALSLKLEKYTDIFSSFDIRPYTKRALSIDFLDEIKRAISDKKDEEGIEIILNMPERERNESHETTIKERLAAHFKRHHALVLQEKYRILKLGISMVVLGIMSMIAATFIIFEDPADNLMLSFLIVFLEPAAWFLLWEGMDLIIFNSKKLNPDLSFYKKMSYSHTHVHFKSY
ncbi:hypothetical protein HYW73_03925 [Candidatus Nomurabacteria bacterium]|nr:hypothetical protein [Candidatus Nomurabacteria bacterium]